jgi:hypothetical protein
MTSGTRVEELRLWRGEAAEALDRAQQEFQTAQRRLDEARERLALLDRLAAVEGDGGKVPNSSPAVDELLDACERFMREAGRPLHISELHAALLKNGVRIPGRGSEANVIVRLQRSAGRFVRTGRGRYAPTDFGLPDAKPVRRRRISRPVNEVALGKG